MPEAPSVMEGALRFLAWLLVTPKRRAAAGSCPRSSGGGPRSGTEPARRFPLLSYNP